MTITVTLPDGSTRQLPSGSTILNLAEGIGPGLARAALAGKINGVLCDLSTPLNADCSVAIMTYRDPEGARILRHTAAHIMAMAIKRLYLNAVLEDGPATDTGYFYDIEMPDPISADAFPVIEEEMRKIVDDNLPIARRVLPRDEAIKFFTDRRERFKVETIQSIPEGETVSIYEMGEFADLCRGRTFSRPAASRHSRFRASQALIVKETLRANNSSASMVWPFRTRKC